jgi:hypothetical protein
MASCQEQPTLFHVRQDFSSPQSSHFRSGAGAFPNPALLAVADAPTGAGNKPRGGCAEPNPRQAPCENPALDGGVFVGGELVGNFDHAMIER